MLSRKMDFGISICSAATILGLLSTGNPLTFLTTTWSILTARTALETMAAVILVGVLSGVCRNYGILDRIVSNLKIVVANPRIILMAVPGIIGLLPVPGGAAMSVPFVDSIAEDYGVSPTRKAAMNLVFRHAGMLLMPFSTTVIVALSILGPYGVTYGLLVSRTGFYVLFNMVIGYFIFMRTVPTRQTRQPEGDRNQAVRDLLLNLSPILTVVFIAFTIKPPIYICVGLGILVAYVISDKKDFVRVLLKVTNPKMALIIVGINMMQGFIQKLDHVIYTLTGTLGDGAMAIFAFAMTSAFLALITGVSLTPLGIILPLVVAIPQSTSMLLANTYLIFTASFLGYYFSPLHLCQVLTVEYLKCSTQGLLKEYRLYAAGLLTIAMVGYALFWSVAGWLA